MASFLGQKEIKEFVEKRQYKELNAFIYKSPGSLYFKLKGLEYVLAELKSQKVSRKVRIERNFLYILTKLRLRIEDFKENYL